MKKWKRVMRVLFNFKENFEMVRIFDKVNNLNLRTMNSWCLIQINGLSQQKE